MITEDAKFKAVAAEIKQRQQRGPVLRREPLGELNLDQLGARLAEELRRGLCDVVDSKGRGRAVSLGEGTE